jgi:uncharacterized protein (TIGR03435 family)
MTSHFSEDHTDDFGAAVARFRHALDQRVDAHLKAHPHAGVPRVTRVATARFSTRPWTLGAAVATVIIAIGGAIVWPRGPQVYAAGDNGLQFTLADDSRVEMRAHSELTVDRAADGIRIDLKKGDIIVNAAKQRDGHLYVHTKDVTVAVVGTVFLVNAEDDGSHVGVIEGEVRVREGTIETTLRPGEQVSTSPALIARPLTEAVAWSRRGEAYAAILTAFEKGMAQTSGQLRPLDETPDSFAAALGQAGAAAVSQEFEEASIRECDPDNLPPAPAGARGGGANSLQMTPGRMYALCVTPATLIRTAYGYAPANIPGRDERGLLMKADIVYGLGVEDGLRVRGGPDWVRSQFYTIEAVAGSPADAETMRGPMLRGLLERRFRLRAHVETEQVPAFVLTVAPGGLKIKPVSPNPCQVLEARPGSGLQFGHPTSVLTAPPTADDVRRGAKPACGGSWGGRAGQNMTFVAGDVPIEALIQYLRIRLGGVRVLDKTGVTDRFNFFLEFALDENAPGLRGVEPPPPPSDGPRAATIFTALEEQLGLRLEQVRAPREFVVIDAIERPSPN